MATKYIQKVIPSVSTLKYRGMQVSQLRNEAAKDYMENCAGKTIINLHTKIPIQCKNASARKTAYGGAIYAKKVALIKKIPKLLEHAVYNNFGQPKPGDDKTLIGYYNFKAYVLIDDKKESVRLAVKAFKNGTFYYNVEVSALHKTKKVRKKS